MMIANSLFEAQRFRELGIWGILETGEIISDIIVNFYANSIVYFDFTQFFIESNMVFQNRNEAGSWLGKELIDFQKDTKAVVLGLPRGGVLVAEEVAKFLHLPLDVILLRKLPYPSQPELAVGAVAEHGAVFVNEEFQNAAREEPGWLEEIIREQREIIRQRAKLYRPHRHARDLQGKTAILVDDGIATGATMKVAIQAARAAGADRVVVAIPVAAPSSIRELETEADQVVCLDAPENFYAVGQAYQSFEQVSDKEVCEVLDRNA